MPVAPTFGADLLRMIFQAKGIANLCDNTVTSPSTTFWAALHTAAPSSDGQTSNEAAYTSYTRIPIERSSAAWSVSAGSSAGAYSGVSPLAVIDFPQAAAGTETETDFSVGLSSAGPGRLLVSGTLSPALSVAPLVTPSLTTGTTITIS